MDQQTWMTLVGLAGFALALFSYLGVIRRDLVGQITGVDYRLTSVRDELKADISDLRTELKGEITGVDHRLVGVRDELKVDISDLRHELKGEIGELRTELKTEITAVDHRLVSVRDELKADISKLDGHMTVMEQRTYDLRGLLGPAPRRTESG